MLLKRLNEEKLNEFKCFGCGEPLSIDLSSEIHHFKGCCEETNLKKQYWKIL